MKARISPLMLFYLALAITPVLSQNLFAFSTGAAEPEGSQLWKILNSSFALWFLSSVVVGTLTALVARYQKDQSERAQKATVERRLNTEISSRLADGLVAMRLDHKRVTEKSNVYFASAMYNEAIYYLDNRVTDNDKNPLDFSVYPEYKHRRFRSLLFELSAVAEHRAMHALHEAKHGLHRT